jgi:hypothetical protein
MHIIAFGGENSPRLTVLQIFWDSTSAIQKKWRQRRLLWLGMAPLSLFTLIWGWHGVSGLRLG